MDTPKPHPPVSNKPKESKKDEKTQFVRKPHLTHRPFADNAAFRKLGTKTINPKAKRQK